LRTVAGRTVAGRTVAGGNVAGRTVADSDGDFGKYFHLPVSVNFGKWILFTGKLPVNQKNKLTP
jgi:hypothetical protein